MEEAEKKREKRAFQAKGVCKSPAVGEHPAAPLRCGEVQKQEGMWTDLRLELHRGQATESLCAILRNLDIIFRVQGRRHC